jgi:putative ABC transport system permease protein
VTMDEIVARSLSDRRFSMMLLGAFATIALVLASIGIYGVMTYSVSQRTREIGIRLSLGAKPTDVLHLVVRQAARLVATGVVVGFAAALLVTRLLTGLLFAVSTSDPVTYLLVALLLAGFAIAACLLPARRAMRIDPLVTLRSE